MYYVDICRHIKTNGLQCRGVALTGSTLCYFHNRLHRCHAPYRFTAATQGYLLPGQHIQLGPLEDREAVQVAISQVVNALATGHLDVKHAMALLYGLQLASSNAAPGRLHLEPHPPKAMREVFHEPEGSESAGLDLAEPGAVYKFDADPETFEEEEDNEDVEEEDEHEEDEDEEEAAHHQPATISTLQAAQTTRRRCRHKTATKSGAPCLASETWACATSHPKARIHRTKPRLRKGLRTPDLSPAYASSAKGATHASLGRRPRYRSVTEQRAEGPAHNSPRHEFRSQHHLRANPSAAQPCDTSETVTTPAHATSPIDLNDSAQEERPMAHGIIRSLSTILALTLLSQLPAQGQDLPMNVISIPVNPPHNWDYALSRAQSQGKLLVITMAQPTHRIACQIQSFTVDQLTCKGHSGATRIYKPEEIAALITPGDSGLQRRLFLGFNAALGGAIWGTVVLAPVCIPCAVGTGVAALIFLSLAGAVSFVDTQYDSYLYLSPTDKLYDPKGNPIHLKPLR